MDADRFHALNWPFLLLLHHFYIPNGHLETCNIAKHNLLVVPSVIETMVQTRTKAGVEHSSPAEQGRQGRNFVKKPQKKDTEQDMEDVSDVEDEDVPSLMPRAERYLKEDSYVQLQRRKSKAAVRRTLNCLKRTSWALKMMTCHG